MGLPGLSSVDTLRVKPPLSFGGHPAVTASPILGSHTVHFALNHRSEFFHRLSLISWCIVVLNEKEQGQRYLHQFAQ